MSKGIMAKRLKERLSEKDALKRHNELMKDPRYAEGWNRLTTQLRGYLADLPEDVLPDDDKPAA